ncbi:MMB_0454 family protein [Mycoplasmopsis columbinasalis]|uniref:Uncharacterized protein n=1 Tax=Mycoplasmopsis columbinasalis TaxID=114880 RepID=A0A449BAR0_9BACT|nr:hypothetical protein [Mycoplasmopsis columbinasalis]VEU78285.1 Uncharacterised protein [Mycoplasmopsis columbinasalis]
MSYVTVNYSIKQAYTVVESTFYQFLDQLVADLPVVELVGKPEILYSKNNDNAGFVIDLKIKRGQNLANTLNEFTNEFYKRFYSLLEMKPLALKICFCGYFD